MTKKYVLQKIFDNLSLEMKALDFLSLPREQKFIKETDDSIFTYQLLIYDRTKIAKGAKGFQIEPYIWINVKEIEEYYKEITFNSELKKDLDYVTLGNSVAEIISNPDGIHREWNCSLNLVFFKESDIASLSNELMEQFTNVARPYFKDNDSIKRVDEILNASPQEYCVHMSNDLYRFIKGIIAAKLNKNPKTEQLVKIYNDLIVKRNMPDYCKEEMFRLINILPMIGSVINI